MAIYLKKFENHTQYDTYINGSDAILPNVSICTTEGDVHYNHYVESETRVVAKFNVTDTSKPIQIIYKYSDSPFSEIEIDGVVQPNIVSEYTFDTVGEHTVKYTLTDTTSIGRVAFYYSWNLISIDIPDSVTFIGDSAFGGCKGLTSIIIPDNVTNIGSGAFSNCSNLTSITVGSNNTVYDSRNDCNAIIETNTNTLIQGCKNTVIPNTVTSIRSMAFHECNGLTSIVIPDSVTSIGDYAFGSTSLTSIEIPSGVTSIGDYAFVYCWNLANIVSNAITAPTIKSSTFQNVKTYGKLSVPIGSTGYDVWMGTGDYYLGKYYWTKVEQ